MRSDTRMRPRRQIKVRFEGTITLAELWKLQKRAERGTLGYSLMIAAPMWEDTWCQVGDGPKLRVVATRAGRCGYSLGSW